MEGIGPKIDDLIRSSGISIWNQLAESNKEKLKSILDAEGGYFQMHDPSTWPQQASLAAKGL